MHNPSLRVLVAENQYLIAMEVERILLDAFGCDVTITPLSQLERQLAISRYDLVVVDSAPSGTLNLKRAEMIATAGASVIFLTSYDEEATENPNLLSFPVIEKPIHPEELTRAVLAATAQPRA
ncbi:response regulator [Rhizobium sp. S-51]|uniref:Response regulator n=1 Tax=Rhizobium terricola TaxID=2728849 RepID=A0A7Y0FY32_9HYPH|nr:hypothetical protein [Rhizobium terricola]NML76515.1 response regulator [Rhizobium terricola]